MRFTIYILTFLVLGGTSLSSNDKPVKQKKTKEFSTSKEDREVKSKKEDKDSKLDEVRKEPKQEKEGKEEKPQKELREANTFSFQGSDLGRLWEKSEKKNQLIYSPDSMRKASKYKKFIFDLTEFKKLGGTLNKEADFTIHYSVLQTDIETQTPDDPNMPSPAGGFTYIINTCRIEKLEVN